MYLEELSNPPRPGRIFSHQNASFQCVWSVFGRSSLANVHLHAIVTFLFDLKSFLRSPLQDRSQIFFFVNAPDSPCWYSPRVWEAFSRARAKHCPNCSFVSSPSPRQSQKNAWKNWKSHPQQMHHLKDARERAAHLKDARERAARIEIQTT